MNHALLFVAVTVVPAAAAAAAAAAVVAVVLFVEMGLIEGNDQGNHSPFALPPKLLPLPHTHKARLLPEDGVFLFFHF